MRLLELNSALIEDNALTENRAFIEFNMLTYLRQLVRFLETVRF